MINKLRIIHLQVFELKTTFSFKLDFKLLIKSHSNRLFAILIVFLRIITKANNIYILF